MPDYSNAKIYKIVNTVNEKIYIGSTTRTLAKRMTGHRMDAKTRSSKIYKAMRRHGIENFSIVLIKPISCSSKSDLEDAEYKITNEYKLNNIKLYNVRFDGKISEETKVQLSAMARGSQNHRFGKVGAASSSFRRGSVCYHRGGDAWAFQYQENGKRRSKHFAVKKYGEEEAKRLAEEYRNKIYPLE